MEVTDLHKVWEIKALKRPQEEEARRILENVAKQVQPIMRRRKWRVKILSEFCPGNAALLGLNVGRGVHVKLRLRKPRGTLEFFSYEEVLDTMLHELCHIEHGPHNALFYKLWDDIRKPVKDLYPSMPECEELIAKGISGTGQGFDAPGRRLGGFSRQPPLSSLRETALVAAEKRKLLGILLPSGPKRLGGNSNIMASLTPVQAAAMAAERRVLDDLWCASESCEHSCIPDALDDDVDNQGFKRSALTLGKDLSRAGSESQINAHGGLHTDERAGKRIRSTYSTADAGASSSSDGLRPSISGPSFKHGYIDNKDDRIMWECHVCTLFNKPLALACDACGSERPRDSADGSKTWSCRFCTLENVVEMDKCSACGEWRYSRGAPASTRGPNWGT